MPHKNCYHDLVHGEYHCGGRTSLAEHVADIDNIGDARPIAAEVGRDHHSKQALCTRGCEGFRWETGVTVDGIGIFRRCRCRDFRPAG